MPSGENTEKKGRKNNILQNIFPSVKRQFLTQQKNLDYEQKTTDWIKKQKISNKNFRKIKFHHQSESDQQSQYFPHADDQESEFMQEKPMKKIKLETKTLKYEQPYVQQKRKYKLRSRDLVTISQQQFYGLTLHKKQQKDKIKAIYIDQSSDVQEIQIDQFK